MPNLTGSSVNAGGTKIATAKTHGSSTLDTTKPLLDPTTYIKHGNLDISVKSAINMGLLNRDSSGVLVELNGPVTPTRVG